LIIGMRIRFAMKPGVSVDSTAVLPSIFASSRVRVSVASLVWRPRMSSTYPMTGTGFMKCMPTTLSGRFVAAASRVIEMLEVFDARIASGLHAASSVAKSAVFTTESSNAASTTTIHVREIRHCRAGPDPPGDLRGRARELALRLQPAEGLRDRGLPALQLFRSDVHEHDLQAGCRAHLGDAGAHRPGADDPHLLH